MKYNNLLGDVSELYGDMSWLRGDIDQCELTDIDRERGIEVSKLIKKK